MSKDIGSDLSEKYFLISVSPRKPNVMPCDCDSLLEALQRFYHQCRVLPISSQQAVLGCCLCKFRLCENDLTYIPKMSVLTKRPIASEHVGEVGDDVEGGVDDVGHREVDDEVVCH